MYHFHSWDKRGLLVSLPSNNKGWHKRFFFVSGEGWEYPPEEENPVGVLRTWGSPLQRAKIELDLEPEEKLWVSFAFEKKWDLAELLSATASSALVGAETDKSIRKASARPEGG
ncbi:hypothetical protein CJ030_MR8G004871 [Morella rubra]|uniref:Uncharacterized protein n=1 Tax=Morella rubra TaxID=262757 RepID=A0A6A1USL2_9ROSI|nr:hypothetical protein CJ030_MR8G004871 [Morella rubra]